MRSVIIAAALLVGTAAYAQDTGTPQGAGAMAGGQTVEPGNAAPERDARGIPVVSAPATAPAGWNQPPGTPGAAPPSASAPTEGSAGPLPPCSRKVTDHCTQTYERNHGDAGAPMAASGGGGDMAASSGSGDDMAASGGETGHGKKMMHHRRRHRRG